MKVGTIVKIRNTYYVIIGSMVEKQHLFFFKKNHISPFLIYPNWVLQLLSIYQGVQYNTISLENDFLVIPSDFNLEIAEEDKNNNFTNEKFKIIFERNLKKLVE